MVISPNDFSLWARLTGNKYPSTPTERAQKGPEVHNFIQNLGKEGMLEGKETKEPKKEGDLGKKIAKGALIAGGIAAAVAAGRDERVQNTVKRAAAATRTKTDDFLSSFARPKDVDVDIVDASGDVTPDPSVQQSNVAPQPIQTEPENTRVQVAVFGTDINDLYKSANPAMKELIEKGTRVYTPELPGDPNTFNAILTPGTKPAPNEKVIFKPTDSFTPISEGKPSFTEGSISKENSYEDISNLEQRVDRTYGKYLSNLNPEDAATTRQSLIREAGKARDFELGYMNSMARGRTDKDATITGRKFGGYDLDPAVGPQTPYRKALSELKIASTVPAQVDELINLVKTGPKIVLPESVQQGGALVSLGTGNTTDVIPTNQGEVGGDSLTNEHLTKMEVENVIDDARDLVRKPVETGVSQNRITTILPRSGPAGDESTQDFIDRKFSVSAGEAGDPLPEKSGTVIDPDRFPGGNIKDRLNDLRIQNTQALASGNVTPAMQKVLGGRLKSGLIYKNSPELLQRDSEILTSAMISGGSKEYFGPGPTKVKQNVKLGAQFPEILDDPTRETVIFQGKERPRTDFETPVTTPDAQQRYEANVQKKIDYRDTNLQNAESQFETTSGKIENLQNKIAESGENIKNVVAGLPERTDLTPTEKAITKTGLETRLNSMRKQYGGLNERLDKARDFFNKRATGLNRSMEEKIAGIPVEKTIKSQTGELYNINEKVNPTTGEKTETIRPAFSRIEDNETGSSRGSQLRDPGVGQEYLGVAGKIVGEEDKGTGKIRYRTSDTPILDKKGKPVLMFTEEKVRGDKPMSNLTGNSMEAQIQDLYSPKYNYDRQTITRKAKEIGERFKKQQTTRGSGGLTIEEIKDL